jgi:dTDP-L-rhamnose 4-epimerase
MRALVTGGAGFIGSHTCDALLERGYEVRILDNLEPRVHPRGCPTYIHRGIEFVKGDVRDRAALECALADVEVVFHQAGHQDCMPEYAKLFHSNVVSTALLFDAIRDRRFTVRKVVVASSQAVYGEGQYCCPTHGLVLGEPRRSEDLERGDWEARCGECSGNLVPVLLRESRPNPTNAFGVSKFAQEMAALRLGRDLGIPTVVLRYSIVQGARQSFYNAYSGICRNFMRAVHSGKAPVIFEDGMQLRDYVHVSDVVAANLLVLENSHADWETFNVGSGFANSVLDYARVMLHRMNSQLSPEIPGIYRKGDARHNVSSIAKMESLGWKTTKGLNEIFDDYLAWLQATPDFEDYATPAFAAMQRAGVLRFAVRAKASSALA